MCQAVRQVEVLDALASGVSDVDELAEQLGVGTGCGTCRDYAQRLIDDFSLGGGEPLVDAYPA